MKATKDAEATKSQPRARWSRRDFLRASGGCAALGSTSLLSSLLQMQLTRSAAAAVAPAGYRALVCIFQHGGNDSFNMLVPTDADAYGAYRQARGNLALPQAGLHGIVDAAGGRSYGLHPGMPEVADLYRDGRLAFVANVGTLVEPTDKASYGGGARLPLGLFSHSDQQQHWQTSVPQSRSQMTGWAGRMADLLEDSVNGNTAFSMNIAIDRLNILQTGRQVVPYVVDAEGGAELLAGYGQSNPQDLILTTATDNLVSQTYGDLLKSTYARVRGQAIDAAVEYNEATAAVEIATPFPDTTLGNGLKQVARAIGAREALAQRRQIFFLSRGGWDHHDGVLTLQAQMLPEVSQALRAFHDATVELGVAGEVVTFTVSDFGRTLSTNGNGSDHAWGGNHIVMGGAVGGGRLYGAYPQSLAPGAELDVGRGRIIPTTSVDEYAAELAMWFGVANDATLEAILPNLRNFYPSSAGAPPLGFLL